MIRESAAPCKTVLFLLHGCLRLLLIMWVNQLLLCPLLSYGFVGWWPAAVLHVFVGVEVCCMVVGHQPRIAVDTLFEVELLLHEHWLPTWPITFQS